ncbi:hypothetical protein CO179_02540 [candidate division WWE3 bacterium CG_4_9_14_3_um_filter_39_7]|uniref:M23ase beta-sheet core domain-containing protein n=1 Tax=candidate division WWE3 bacterium CG_4_9_14_3_um_filter_39_7 TaxID=1975080 RepID=A0A2M7X2I1_UNCKA|nr:MAG: hypothetical protein CO179_02540 [candidate division WWE3 bacterium CG_4_9_14_3_um_filter_39_7]
MNTRFYRIVLVLFIVFSIGLALYSVANAESEPNPDRCPTPPNRPSLVNPAGGRTVNCYGCGQVNFGHWDSFYNEFYAADFPGSFEVTAAAGGTLKEDLRLDGVLWIDHGGGWYTKYAHLSVIEEAKIGNPVDSGEKIGWSGTVGCGDCGAHLHFELRHGDDDPATNSGWSYAIPELYPEGGNGVCDGTIPTPTAIADPTAVPTPIPTATADPTANDHDPPTGGIVDAPIAANQHVDD